MTSATQNATTPPPPAPKPNTPFARLVKWLKKILVWSLILYLFNWSAKKLGWETWEDFDHSARRLTGTLLDKTAAISPLVLVKNLQTKQLVEDETYVASEPDPGANWFSRLQMFNNPARYRELTFWEKIRIWAGSFWFEKDGSANWFGRVMLALALLLAVQFTWDTPFGKRVTGNYISDIYLLNIFSALLALSMFCLFFYLFVHLLLWVGGALVALFASIAAGGGFFKYVLEEMKSDLVDESKKMSKLT